MEAALFVYLAGVVEGLSLFLQCVAIAGVMSIVGLMIYCSDASTVFDSDLKESGFKTKAELVKERRKLPIRLMKIFSVLTLFIGLLSTIIPDQKTMYFMAGAYIGQKALTSEVSKELQDILELKLKSYKQDLRKELVK